MMRILMLILTVASLSCVAGCPDYSHQRPVPDYDNMTDSGSEAEDENE